MPSTFLIILLIKLNDFPRYWIQIHVFIEVLDKPKYLQLSIQTSVKTVKVLYYEGKKS